MRLIWIFLRLPLIGATIAVISTPPKSAELVRLRSLESIDRKQIFTSTSRNSTGFPRLPTNVVPNYYVLHLDVALKSFSYTGIVTINVDVLEKTKTIKLHSKDTEMVWVTVADGGGLMDSAYYRRGPVLVIVTKKPLMKGPATIQMKFRGKISRTELTGFYASSYNNYYEVNRDGSEFVALTQFEPTGARTTFPCFDEPGLKARFDLKINVDSDYPVDILSNMPSWYDQNSTTVDKTFRRTKWFQPTPVMSTYLLAFAIGRFECLKSHSSDGTPVRVCTRPGESSKARLSLDATVAAFDYFTDLFGVENGIRKVDVLAVPRFSAGAMENWGLITGRQSIFAPYLDHLDTYKKHLLINIVAHEVVHFWFGNLVTMKWWEQLWIKEATSSYFETPFAMNFVPEEDQKRFTSDSVLNEG
ncbi:hypothetical protein L596_001538 [Steinernema carpocapsae]|uniref:Uncharacterized protein n=1 Tax=Steinernema carpocapsae TaxID=34508 RepID=A0A4U8UP41_STECR|nr:hypothetical protein L596_001538 [Steinernema carpocapsae]